MKALASFMIVLSSVLLANGALAAGESDRPAGVAEHNWILIGSPGLCCRQTQGLTDPRNHQRAVGAARIGFGGAHAAEEGLLRHPDSNGVATLGDFGPVRTRGLVRLDLSAEASQHIS